MKKIIFACAFSVMAFAGQAQTTDNLTVVDSTTVFKPLTQPIERGTLIKTSNFHFYEINDKVTQKSGYSSQPEIIVYQDGKKFKMKIQGMEKILIVNKIQEVIESKIEGYVDDRGLLNNFQGYDGTTKFRLTNLQEWKQDQPTSTVFSSLFKPNVIVYLTSEGYKMKIEGIKEDPILVKKTR